MLLVVSAFRQCFEGRDGQVLANDKGRGKGVSQKHFVHLRYVLCGTGCQLIIFVFLFVKITDQVARLCSAC